VGREREGERERVALFVGTLGGTSVKTSVNPPENTSLITHTTCCERRQHSDRLFLLLCAPLPLCPPSCRWPVKSRKESCDSKSRGQEQEQEQEQIHAVSPQWLSPEGRDGQLGGMRVPTALSADREHEAARISDKVVNNFHGSAAAPTNPEQPSAMVGFPSAGAPATNQSHESQRVS
jgi:hypothetical protein